MTFLNNTGIPYTGCH
ncbi:unnamed protein product [Acanthoscelides obtectus]|uniref:Uncharacterized protein n=1 Tax=Acanthoscelides obtectus TaxID=200917 RepID=A0A9P0LQM0_ACAOB|nr:unnamed protein product [Acanthoscelides obtectus]CAK1639314.1 hypothetical protein AOBTE_LOCUS11118 [Acanthoscelides obtectus]